MEKGLLFVYLMTYGGALAAIFKPFWGLMIYFSFAILSPQSMWYWSVPPGNYSRIVAMGLLIGWFLQNFGKWRFYGATSIIFCIVSYWIWAIFSMQMAERPELGMGFIIAFAKVLLPILVGITTIETIAQLKALAWTLALSQGYVAYEFNLAYGVHGWNRVLAPIPFANMDNNSLCIAMVTGCGLCFFLALRDPVPWRRWMMFAFAAMLAHVPMFGDSRGGMLGLVVVGVATFLIIPREPKHYAIFLLAVAVGLRMAGPAVVERFMTIFVEEEERDYSAQSRLDLWAACWDCMMTSPLFGIGPDGWGQKAPDYGFPRGKEAHSIWFQIGAELGFVGVGFLVAYYGLTFLKLWQLTRKPELLPDPFMDDAARMVMASQVGFAVSGSFVSLDGLELPYYVTLLGACTIKLATKPQGRSSPRMGFQQESQRKAREPQLLSAT